MDVKPPEIIFPIESVLPAIREAMARSSRVIISAPPGAGKTTRVPLALLDESWTGSKKIVMLEPRRLAARRSAEFMAAQRNEKAGDSVGFVMRGEKKTSSRTRIEVVTEGILTRMLQTDPALEEYCCIIFDEFHERSINADLGLALALDVQANLRNDLKLVVMSATLDIDPLRELLGRGKAHVEVIRSEGKSYPVQTRYMRFSSEKSKDVLTADAVQSLLREEEEGDMLVFLPGRREIRFVESLLYERRLPDTVRVHTLYGEAPYAVQQSALAPAQDGERKVILSTSIAETSLTIDGVRIVIDSGRTRMSQFDARRGMSGLVTVPVSKAAADQRRGRAGRQAPGYCMRLWTEAEHERLSEFAQPEIKTADLAPLALALAAWGEPTGERLAFIDPPPAPHLAQARALLQMLGALDRSPDAVITSHGRAMDALPVHPRFAHMMLRGAELGLGGLACTIAALLEERDLFAGRSDADIDLSLRLHALTSARGGGARQSASSAALERIQSQSRRLSALLEAAVTRQRPHARTSSEEESEGLLLALAYPDRIARRKDASASDVRYLTANGTTAVLPKGSMLAREEFLAVGETDSARPGEPARILLAAPLSQQDIERTLAESITREEQIQWSAQDEAVTSRMVVRLGAVVLSERSVPGTDAEITRAMLEGIRSLGLSALPWTREAEHLCARSEWARLNLPDAAGFPPMNEDALTASLDEWLAPFLSGVRRRAQLAQLDLRMILSARLGYESVRVLDREAPSHITLPSGTHAEIDYSSHVPVLAVRLQELFGQTESPAIGRSGGTRLLLHILSPARRPLAVTQDLKSFWMKLYPELRTQMRARYPKHVWPENPLSAAPTNKTKRHQKPHADA